MTKAQFVSTSNTVVTVVVSNGVPDYYAVLVDSTNTAGAGWTSYSGSNLTVGLGSTEGWHNVRIGLRGLQTTSQQTWHMWRLKYDHTPPVLVFTNPASGTVNQPMLELQGYSTEDLSAISYDLTNTNGVATNQQVLVLSQFYDTNTWETTTNFFQAFDVPLTVGTNAFTVYATDLAGNVTTTNLSYVLDYSSRTNPPVITLYWPTNGAQISGTNFTWLGQLDDFTDQLTVQTVDTNGNTNVFNGLVERNGNFWVENLPLTAGTNTLTLIAVDAAGNTNQTNISVVQSTVNLTIDPVSWTNNTVTGTIDSTNYIVWVNGVKATNTGGNTWAATNVPMETAGTAAIQARAIPLSDNGGNGTGGGGGTNTSLDDPGNPGSTNATDTLAAAERPMDIFFQCYTSSMYEEFYAYDFLPTYKNVDSDNTSWTNGPGGMATRYHAWDGFLTPGTNQFLWPASTWPQAVPAAMEWNGTNWQIGTFEYSALGTNMIFGDVPTNVYASDLIAGTNYDYKYAANRCANISLSTGGKAGTGRESLFELSLSVDHLFPPSGLALGPPDGSLTHVTYSNLAQIWLGTTLGHLGADGKLWVVLPDGISKDITPYIPGLDYYQFYPATPVKHHLSIAAGNGITTPTLLPDAVATNATFVVGQQISFSPQWDSAPTGVLTNYYQWSFSGTYVNESNQPCPTCSVNYTNDPVGLTNATPTNWWVTGSLFPGTIYTASLTLTVVFTNGQTATNHATGQFAMIRPLPQFTNQIRGSVTVDSNYWLNSIYTGYTYIHFGINSNNANAGIAFIYTGAPLIPLTTNTYGTYSITQVIDGYTQRYNMTNGSGACTAGYLTNDTQGLDTENPYEGTSSSLEGFEWTDGPGAVLSSAHWLSYTNSFSTYLMFDPGSSGSIRVPMSKFQWNWFGSATNGPPWGKVSGLPSAGDSASIEQFPFWTHTISGLNTDPSNMVQTNCFTEN